MRDQAGVVSYYLADHLGSIVQATSVNGVVTLTRDYDPWGNPIQGSASSGYAFTGREWDPETGLYYYRARYYDPRIGRFLSEDPLEFASDFNFYLYVANEPINSVDPSGLTRSLPRIPRMPPPLPTIPRCTLAELVNVLSLRGQIECDPNDRCRCWMWVFDEVTCGLKEKPVIMTDCFRPPLCPGGPGEPCVACR